MCIIAISSHHHPSTCPRKKSTGHPLGWQKTARLSNLRSTTTTTTIIIVTLRRHPQHRQQRPLFSVLAHLHYPACVAVSLGSRQQHTHARRPLRRTPPVPLSFFWPSRRQEASTSPRFISPPRTRARTATTPTLIASNQHQKHLSPPPRLVASRLHHLPRKLLHFALVFYSTLTTQRARPRPRPQSRLRPGAP